MGMIGGPIWVDPVANGFKGGPKRGWTKWVARGLGVLLALSAILVILGWVL